MIVGVSGLKVAVGKSAAIGLGVGSIPFGRSDWRISREKPLRSVVSDRTKTDTGRWGEDPKALERTLVKELGKLTP